jgi:hypothetical protein
MKPCPTRLQLEAAVLGEVHPSRAAELEAHADGCVRCRHELNWLRAETALFAQRTAREEVSRLWEGVEASTPRRGQRLTRAVLAVAASLLLAVLVGGQRLHPHPRGAQHSGSESLMPMSLEMMSVEQESALRATMPCYTPGFGIACGEVEYASR